MWERFWGWRKKRRTAGRGKVGVVGIVVTALVGFFFGIATSQASDFAKRVDECSAALSQYMINITTEYPQIVVNLKRENLTEAEMSKYITAYNRDIQLPLTVIQNRCPMDAKNSEYLNGPACDRQIARFPLGPAESR